MLARLFFKHMEASLLTLPHILHEHAELGISGAMVSEVRTPARLILRQQGVDLEHDAASLQSHEALLD